MTDNHDDEADVDLMDIEVPEDAECSEMIGKFLDFETFARLAVETLVYVDGTWLLDCLDWSRVRTAMEVGDLYRFRLSNGTLFRDTLRRGPFGPQE